MQQERIDKLNSFQTDKLIRAGQDISFSEQANKIESLINFLRDFYSSESIQNIYFKDDEKNTINDIYNRTVSLFDRILGTSDWGSIDTNQIQQIRTDIDNEFNNIVGNNFQARVAAAKALEASEAGDTSQLRQQARSLVRQIESQAKTVEERTKKIAEDLGQTIEASFGKKFSGQAKSHREAARWWLGALILVVVAYSSFAGWLLYKLLDKNLSDINGISAVVKLAALLVGLYVITMISRNYSAHKHLEVVNEHRANVFAVINDLVEAQGDDKENRQFLLAYGAKVIFDLGETGYLSRNYGAGTEDDGGIGLFLDRFTKRSP